MASHNLGHHREKASTHMRRLTKGTIGKAIKDIERYQDLDVLNAGAALLGRSVKCLYQDNSMIEYDGVVYANLAECMDDVLVDLGSKQRGLTKRR